MSTLEIENGNEKSVLGSSGTALIEALKVALPYVERVAATAPFEMNRQKRQRQACADAEMIRALLKAQGKS